MIKYLITFYSGDLDIHNTPVLVSVYQKDKDRFERFLRECYSLGGYGTTYKMIEDIDSYIYHKYFVVQLEYATEILFPQDYFDMYNSSYVYDEGREPTENPASLHGWYIVEEE